MLNVMVTLPNIGEVWQTSNLRRLRLGEEKKEEEEKEQTTT